MTSASFIGAQLLYLLLGALCLLDYLRWRDRPRLFVALTFGSFAGFIIVQDLLSFGPNHLLQVLANLLLLSHAALQIFLIHFIVPVSRWLRRLALWELPAAHDHQARRADRRKDRLQRP